MTQRVIFLNRFYWPDEPATAQLLTDLAEALAARGRSVAVIASHPGDTDIPDREHRARVEIYRVRSHRSAETAAPRKALAFLTFHLRAASMLSRLAQPGDVVVALTDPPLLTVGVTRIARQRGAQVINWIQDIYPEVAIELTHQRWLSALRPLRDRAWRQAARCITLGRDMAAAVAATGVSPGRIATIPNWSPAGVSPAAPLEIETLRHRWSLAGRFVVAYSGNLGRVHDLDPVLDLAAALHDDPRIQFLFIGGGAQRAALQAAAAQRGLSHIQFHPAVPRVELSAALGVGDLHLVTLRPGCERFVFPSKLYGIAAAARPVLFIGPRDSEIATLIREHAFGLAFERHDIPALAAAVARLADAAAERDRLAQAAARFAGEHSLSRALATWENEIAAVAGASPAASAR